MRFTVVGKIGAEIFDKFFCQALWILPNFTCNGFAGLSVHDENRIGH